MCILITVTENISGLKKKLTKGMISSIAKNTNGTANIYLQNENIAFDTTESYEWVISGYQKLKD